MEELKYTIEDSTIVELLGRQNFTNKESAILELVKNSFDAKADVLNITFENGQLIIEDDGIGMDAIDIKQKWMRIGKSEKDYEIKDKNNNKRILAGSKGIGRLALARLGTDIEVYSKKDSVKNKTVLWTTDWSKSILKEVDHPRTIGTKIIISELRDKWNQTSINKLIDFLSRTYNCDLMKINMIFNQVTTPINKYFSDPIVGYNCASKISLKFLSNNNHLVCSIESKEFKIEAKNYVENINLNEYQTVVDCLKELKNDKNIDLTVDELKVILKELGDFEAEFYFSLKESNSKDMEKFLYKDKTLSKRYDSGIILYRNSFSISSYDGTKDWLGLGKRARLSPAAASHPNGAWRIRDNQLAGKVEIDKKKNFMLKDLSNRQGIDENIYYDLFIKIIGKGIAEFERYRQSIIRKIDKKNNILEEEKKIVDKVIKNPKIIQKMSVKEVDTFVSEIKEYKKENSNFKKEIHTTEERYKYDIRILNVLATSGLKATAIAHEMHNHRNSVDENCNNIIDAMKAYGIWELVNEDKRKKYAYSNIPELISKNRKINKKLVSFMDTVLEEVEKSNFFAEEHNILTLLNTIKEKWRRDYSWIVINLDLKDEIIFVLPEDSIKVIFDNLILNSIQQNENRNHLEINVEILYTNGILEFIYKDDGIGLDEKYIKEPMRILEVHETSRKEGHGLGMWMVNNTILMSGGEIKEIKGDLGFNIRFTIGGNLNG